MLNPEKNIQLPCSKKESLFTVHKSRGRVLQPSGLPELLYRTGKNGAKGCNFIYKNVGLCTILHPFNLSPSRMKTDELSTKYTIQTENEKRNQTNV